MKILQINTVYKNGGSTGRIVYDLQKTHGLNGTDSYVAYGYNTSHEEAKIVCTSWVL